MNVACIGTGSARSLSITLLTKKNHLADRCLLHIDQLERAHAPVLPLPRTPWLNCFSATGGVWWVADLQIVEGSSRKFLLHPNFLIEPGLHTRSACMMKVSHTLALLWMHASFHKPSLFSSALSALAWAEELQLHVCTPGRYGLCCREQNELEQGSRQGRCSLTILTFVSTFAASVIQWHAFLGTLLCIL